MAARSFFFTLMILMSFSSQGVAQRFSINDLEEIKHAPYGEANLKLEQENWSIWNTQGDTIYYGYGLKSNKARYWLTLIKNDRGWIDQLFYHFQRATFLYLKEVVDNSDAFPYRSEDHEDGIKSIYLQDKFKLTFWIPDNTKQLFYLHIEEVKDASEN